MRRGVRAGLAAGSLVFLAAAAAANTWVEMGDAPSLPPGQETLGAGSLDTILGTLAPNTSDADVYAIEITSPATFSAFVTGPSLDPRVFLFDPSGFGIASHDDQDFPSDLDAFLPPGDPLYASLSPGRYLLAVTEGASAVPRAFDGASFGNIFPGGDVVNVLGPTGAGGNFPLSNWLVTTPVNFPANYAISLTGAQFAPEPRSALLVGAALLCLLALARRVWRQP